METELILCEKATQTESVIDGSEMRIFSEHSRLRNAYCQDKVKTTHSF